MVSLRYAMAAWALSAFTLCSAHTCIHDKVQPHVKPVSAPQVMQSPGRRLEQSSWAPLRIVPIYTNLTGDPLMTPVAATLISFVQEQLVPAAVAKWASLLSTESVVGNLFAHRDCLSYFTSTTPWLCASRATSVTCNSNDGFNVIMNSTYIGADTYYPSSSGPASTIAAEGPGLADADFGLIVTAYQTALCGSGGQGTLAYAYSCERDSTTDRPTWGRVNFCPAQLKATSDFTMQFGVAMHEIAHAIGFTSSSWPLFRNNDTARTPRTPRNPNVPSLPADNYKIRYVCSNTNYTAYVPADTTIQYMDERGMNCVYPTNITTPSNCVAKFVTPSALAAARFYFNCSNLNGAELENQMTSPCDLQASHWEQRIFSQEDSGWYTADFSAADWLRPSSDWGYAQGCDFATNKCMPTIDATVGLGDPAHFYGQSRGTNVGTGVCTTDHRAVGYTSLSNYQSSLPTQYRYFTNPATGGGPPVVFDYCPAVQAYSNGLCSDPADASINAVYFGETYGPSSACITSTLVWTTVSGSEGTGAACYAVTCVGNDLIITVGRGPSSSALTNVTCAPGSAGQPRQVSGFRNTLTCPDPAIICGSVYKYDGPSNNVLVSPGPWPVSVMTTVTPPATALPTPSSSLPASATSSNSPSASSTMSNSVSPTPSRSFGASDEPSPSATVSSTMSGTPTVTPTAGALHMQVSAGVLVVLLASLVFWM